MKKIFVFIFSIFSLFSCQEDCVESPGKIITQEFEVDAFSKLIVMNGLEVHLTQGTTQKVLVRAGEHKMDNVYFKVTDNTLEVKADGSCLLSENYDPILVYITAPNLTSIRNSGEFTIYSDGILTYPSLSLVSEDYQSSYLNYGNFDLQIDNEHIEVVSNGFSNIKIVGQTENLFLGYYSGLGKFDGSQLQAQEVDFFHRGENTLKVKPIQRLTGDIYAMGDIISNTHPPVVEVVEHYTGKLKYQ